MLGRYFGGGMFSLMFQEVREFRSMAYSASGLTDCSSPAYPDDPALFITSLGTQADKTLSAMQLVDSLIRTLPIKENNLESSRYSIVASVNNSYPDFRGLPGEVQRLELMEYKENPDKEILENLPSVDSAALREYYERAVAPAPVVWILVGDRKSLPMNEIASYGKLVELKKADIYK